MDADACRTETTQASISRLLALPIETRLSIYAYVLESSSTNATFTTLPVVGSSNDVNYRISQGHRQLYSDIDSQHIPFVAPYYHPSLLSLDDRVGISVHSPLRNEELGRCEYESHPALLRVSRQVRAEILRYWSAEQRRKFSRCSLFLAYPAGLHVFDVVGSHLLPCVRSVQISGEYRNRAFSSKHAARLPCTADDSDKLISPDTSSLELENLVKSVLRPGSPCESLTLRISYPGLDSYYPIWGDDYSPPVVVLRSFSAGNVSIEIWSGRDSNAVVMTITPNLQNQRLVRTTWRSLDADDSKAKLIVLDPRWPDITLDDSRLDSQQKGTNVATTAKNVDERSP